MTVSKDDAVVHFKLLIVIIMLTYGIVIIDAPDCTGKMFRLKNCNIFQIDLCIFHLRSVACCILLSSSENALSIVDNFNNIKKIYVISRGGNMVVMVVVSPA